MCTAVAEVSFLAFDLFSKLNILIVKYIKMSIFKVAGYVTYKDFPRDMKIFNDTAFYNEYKGLF